jgi:predicted nucleotide-binding protein (sugar kinase/HSP70/actin superfamily)
MKHLSFLAIILMISVSVLGQEKSKTPDQNKKLMTVEASCGQCQFGMEGKGCSLAVRYEGKSYFVDGTKIDDHGDAHSKMGFCNAIRKAEVQGELVNDRFVASYFKLLPVTKAKKQ